MTPLLIGGGGGGEDGGGGRAGGACRVGLRTGAAPSAARAAAQGARAPAGGGGGGTEPGAFILVGLGLVFNGSPYYLPTGGDVLLEVALGRTTVHAAPASVQTGVGIALRVARGIGEMDAELTTNPAWNPAFDAMEMHPGKLAQRIPPPDVTRRLTIARRQSIATWRESVAHHRDRLLRTAAAPPPPSQAVVRAGCARPWEVG